MICILSATLYRAITLSLPGPRKEDTTTYLAPFLCSNRCSHLLTPFTYRTAIRSFAAVNVLDYIVTVFPKTFPFKRLFTPLIPVARLTEPPFRYVLVLPLYAVFGQWCPAFLIQTVLYTQGTLVFRSPNITLPVKNDRYDKDPSLCKESPYSTFFIITDDVIIAVIFS